MAEPEAAIAEKLTALAGQEPETEFEHFLVVNVQASILVGDRNAVSWDGAEYKPKSDEIRNLLRGPFMTLAAEVEKIKKGSASNVSTGELRAAVLSYKDWIVTIRPLAPRGRESRFLVAINKNAGKWIYTNARRMIDTVTEAIGA